MSEEQNSDGWWYVTPHEFWTCPECHAVTPANEWEEAVVACEDCGSHDARRCPNCGERFDHVWGSREIEEASVMSAKSS
jgi:Zn finger protein HypA/HybF involved in hydrogenase expression